MSFGGTLGGSLDPGSALFTGIGSFQSLQLAEGAVQETSEPRERCLLVSGSFKSDPIIKYYWDKSQKM